MEIIAFILVGGVAGWVGSIIMGNNASQGIVGNIIAGVLGSFIGGYIMTFLGSSQTAGITGFDLRSVGVATLGAVIFIALKKKILGL